MFINLHSPASCSSGLRSFLEMFPDKSDCALFRPSREIAHRVFAPFPSNVAEREPPINLRDGPPGSAVYPVAFSTSHRTRRFKNPSSRGRHRSCRVSPSSTRIPRRRGASVRSRGASEMRALFFWATSAPGYRRLLAYPVK